MNHLHFDTACGISGDMLLAALIDLGADINDIQNQLQQLGLEEFSLTTQEVKRAGICAKQLLIAEKSEPQSQSPARCLPDLSALLEKNIFSPGVSARAGKIFRRLAEAEASIHGKLPEEVHFHEISGLDTIIDVIGVCLAIEQLEVATISCSFMTVGTGFVDCAHGRLPLPAPATALLLKGVALRQEDTGCELTTPTGAALATELAESFGVMPEMSIDHYGYGAGSREIAGRSNLLRVFLGQKTDADVGRDMVGLLSCAIDDMTGEEAGFLLQQLMGSGVLDAYVVPCTMKKGRPGFELKVLVLPDDKERIANLVFTQSSTFGLRLEEVERIVLERREVTVDFAGEEVRVKLGFRHGVLVQVSPEYEDCRRLSVTRGLPLRDIYRQAEIDARNMFFQE